VAVAVPKRIFRRAVDRNLLKRRLREAYRHRKPGLYEVLEQKAIALHMVIQFRGREIVDSKTIDNSLGKALDRLVGQLQSNE
jgi:ribonuclease P protein component